MTYLHIDNITRDTLVIFWDKIQSPILIAEFLKIILTV